MEYTRDDARTFAHTQNILRYEIRKNEQNLKGLEREARAKPDQAPALQALIADAKRRIEVLNLRLAENEESEERCVNGEFDDVW